ncbi:hypothetical protein GA707_06775 [Nostocoides sp. F2B08]|uniref:hypothetical protein n=1 Tax=Nostocoides sp. F2B08 TaxID=2653936 RepID=UPI0012636300|nr:hypothetical protein [Tetrasphaera sp. F2B08]KAB7745606.1 hypothetical protein GA707_06775 [Tetrasphaera sp. F2B08]
MKRVLWWVYAVVVFVHGLIHVMGVVEGFGVADVDQLTEPVSGGEAVLWLVAGLLVIAAAVMTVLRSRGWWLVTGVAAVVSQVAILTSWTDARAGTAVNVLMLAAAAYGFATRSHDPASTQGARP